MGIMLGNLSVDEIEKRIGFCFPEDTKNFMNGSRQHDTANIKKGYWHCFDIPFLILCGDAETATRIFESVKSRAGEVKETLNFSVVKGNIND